VFIQHALVVIQKLPKSISQITQLFTAPHLSASIIRLGTQGIKRIALYKHPWKSPPQVAHHHAVRVIGIDFDVFDSHIPIRQDSLRHTFLG
jgi:hypothetical protein